MCMHWGKLFFYIALVGVLLSRITLNNGAVTSVTPLENITIINSATLSESTGLACSSALSTGQNIGAWHYPDGTSGTNANGLPLYSLARTNRVDLYRRAPLPSAREGIYTCRIPDENRAMQTLYVGIYTPASFGGQGEVKGK